MALFLKYRPQTFADLVGQEAVRRTLQNALKAERPSHAYMFSGSRGTGKTSTARIFAKGLNCENLEDGNPCGKCDLCKGTADGSLVDVIEIDAASNRGIDEIRELREKIMFAPNRAKRKVYIIDEVHMLTKEAFNALLKTLEEPPDHAFFCLATTEMHKIPETILSRCQVFIFQRFNQEQLINRLIKICDQEGFTYEKEAITIIAQKAEGGMRDAISLLEQIAAETNQNITENDTRTSLGVSNTQTLEEFYKALSTKNTQAGLDILKSLAMNGQDFRTFGHDFLGFLRAKMFENINQPLLPQILRMIEQIEIALTRLKTSPIVELPLEIAVVNLTQEAATIPVQTSTTTPKTFPPAKTAAPTPPKQTQAPQPAPTPAPTQAPEKPKSPSPEGLSAEAVTNAMKDIAEKSGIPIFAKKSFLTTIPEVDGTQVTFFTDSEFHREKLIESSVISKILGGLKTYFNNESLSVAFVKKEGMKKFTPSSSVNAPSSSNNNISADDFLVF